MTVTAVCRPRGSSTVSLHSWAMGSPGAHSLLLPYLCTYPAFAYQARRRSCRVYKQLLQPHPAASTAQEHTGVSSAS